MPLASIDPGLNFRVKPLLLGHSIHLDIEQTPAELLQNWATSTRPPGDYIAVCRLSETAKWVAFFQKLDGVMAPEVGGKLFRKEGFLLWQY